MSVVVFDPVAFVARYPEFSAVSGATLNDYFLEAEWYLNNSDRSLVTDIKLRAILLNMIVAHLAYLASTDLVGRLSSAAEGSVTAAVSMGTKESTMGAWWNQSKYGASYWQMTKTYRTFQYKVRRG